MLRVVKQYYAPTNTNVLWIDLSDNNRLKIWDVDEWISISDSGYSTELLVQELELLIEQYRLEVEAIRDSIKDLSSDSIKELLGFDKVDNTSDADKPLSNVSKNSWNRLVLFLSSSASMNIEDDKVLGSVLSLIIHTLCKVVDVDYNPSYSLTSIILIIVDKLNQFKEELSEEQTIINTKITSILNSITSINNSISEILDNIQRITDDVEALTSAFQSSIDILNTKADTNTEEILKTNTRLDTLIGGNVSSAIDSFNEIENFLLGITDTETLTVLLSNLQSNLETKITSNTTAINNHKNNTSNPHSVTKTLVGLGNVDNTSDINKPISTATLTALNNKSNIGHTHTFASITNKPSEIANHGITDSLKVNNNANGNYTNVQFINSNSNKLAIDNYIEWWSNPTIAGSTSTSGWFNFKIGNLNARSIKTYNGTSSQFLKADGSLDNNNYALVSALDNYYTKTEGDDAYLPKVLYSVSNTAFLIKTKVKVTESCMIMLHITGYFYNSSGGPIDTTITFRNDRSDTIKQYKALNVGKSIGNINVFAYNNYIYIWFDVTKQYTTICVNGTQSDMFPNIKGNIVDIITNEAMPTEGVTRLVEVTPINALREDNYTDYVTKLGTSNVGYNIKPIYLNNGVPTECITSFGNNSGQIPMSNGTLCTNLNADKLDGEDADTIKNSTLAFKQIQGTNSNTVYDLNTLLQNGGITSNYGSYDYWINGPDNAGYGSALCLKASKTGSLSGMLLWDINHNSATDITRNLYWRAYSGSSVAENNGWGKWHQIAFTDTKVDNAVNADKLANTRTLTIGNTAHNFNGSANVNWTLDEIGVYSKATIDAKLQSINIDDILSYGVSWLPNVADPVLTRVGNMNYHKTLPIQSGMKGCIYNPKEKKVIYWLDEDNWAYKKGGNPNKGETEALARLDGYDGEIMVYVPEFYIKSWDEPERREVRISPTKIDETWEHLPAVFIGAYKDTVLNTVPSSMGYLSTLEANTAISVANSNTYCRGGNNSATNDASEDVFKRQLGKCRTSIVRGTFREYARKAGKEIMSYRQYKNIIYWLYVVEYANFNSQAAFNAELTAEGFHQGGLGTGLTNVSNWNEYNSYYPISPNGYTNNLGNGTGTKLIAPLGPAPIGNVFATRWRGIENPFGDTWTNVDGVIIDADADNHPNNMNYVYTTDNPALYGDSLADMQKMELTGLEVHTDGYTKEWNLGNSAEIIPRVMGGNTTQYKCDYHWTGDKNTSLRTLLLGGRATYSAYAGLGSFASDDGVGLVYANVGFRSIVSTE